MRDDEFTKIISELKEAGFNLMTVQRHLGFKRFRLNNYRIGATSFSEDEQESIRKYHKAAMKLAGVSNA